MIVENLQTLKIHKLTEAQYQRTLSEGNIDPNALYLTPDESLIIDNTLSIDGAAADAAAVGEAIAAPKYVAQDTAPEDINLLWIDTSDEVGTAANPKTEIILKSSTAGSTKQFRITINDDGVLTATEIG